MANKFDEIGSTGITSWGGYYREAYDTKLMWPACEPLYSRIWRSDPETSVVRQLFDALSGQLEIGWELPEHVAGKDLGEPTDDDRKALEFAYSVTEDLEGGISDWLNSCMTHVPFFGWGWWECPLGVRKDGWKAPNDDPWRSQYNDGLVGYRRLAWRDYSSFYVWDVDDYSGRLRGLGQLAIPNPPVTIPLDRSLHVTYGDNVNPEGLATLEAIWRLERIKFALEFINGTGFEHAAGHVKFTADGDLTAEDKALIRTAARAVMTAQEGNYMALPAKIQGDIIDVPFTAASSLLSAIQYYGVLKLSLFGMQFVALSATTGAGSYAAMDDSSSMAITMINAMAAQFARQADQQIGRRLFDNPVNAAAFPGMTRRPRMVLAQSIQKKISLSELGQFAGAMNAIMPLSKEDMIAVRSKSGFLPETVEEPEEPQPEEQQQEQEAIDENQEGQASESETDALEEQANEEPAEMVSGKASFADSVVVALRVPPSVAVELETFCPEDAEVKIDPRDMHLTLAFLGKTKDQTSSKADLLEVAETFAANEKPVSGTYRKSDRFGNPDSEYGDAIVALLDSDTIADFQKRLADGLKQAGFELSTKHDFTAHTTLGYVPVDKKMDSVEIPETSVTFNDLFVKWGVESKTIPIGNKEMALNLVLDELKRAVELERKS